MELTVILTGGAYIQLQSGTMQMPADHLPPPTCRKLPTAETQTIIWTGIRWADLRSGA